jgi:lysophospholipase
MRAKVLNDTPDNTAPDNVIGGYFEVRDGVRLRYAVFRSPATIASGTVVLLQGRNETIEKYYETIRELTDAGLWVATFDWRGQGGSERLIDNPLAGYVRRYEDYVSDLEQFIEAIVLPDARLPFFLIGHSMGGLIALLAAPRLANRIERMTVTSPFIGLHGRQAGTSIVRLVSSLATAVGLGGLSTNGNRPINQTFEGNGLTHDPARFARNKAIYDSVPRLRLAGPTFRWVRESFKAIKTVNDPDHLASIRIPTLILAAGADNIVPIAEVEELASRFRAAELITIDHARHEMFQESDIYREQVMAAVRTFLPGGES